VYKRKIIGRSPRIVEIDHLYVDCNITGRFLFVENDDRPGIVGVVGTALGTAGVNIANMDLSRTADRTRALTVIEVDSEPPLALLEQLRSTPGILRVLTLEL
jgi:D-3-phosphoglycerate dehydrogenase